MILWTTTYRILSLCWEIDLRSKLWASSICLRKTNFEEEDVEPRSNFRINLRRGERSWSGNLVPTVKPRHNLPRSRSRSNLNFSNISKKIPTFLHHIHNVETLYDRSQKPQGWWGVTVWEEIGVWRIYHEQLGNDIDNGLVHVNY